MSFWRLLTLVWVLHSSWAVKIHLNTDHNDYPSPQRLQDASVGLARHLGLDILEPYSMLDSQDLFVGKAKPGALLLTVHESDSDILPSAALYPTVIRLGSAVDQTDDSILAVASTCADRAQNIYPTVLEAWHVDQLYSFFDELSRPKFATLELSALAQIREEYGKDSEEYRYAVQHVRSFLGTFHAKLHIAIITYSPQHSHIKRQQSPLPSNRPPPQQPLGSVSTCFTSADSCSNATSSCSGKGQCVQATKAGKTCFVCTCSVTTSGEGKTLKTQRWVGESCERLDISGPFTLLTGTVLALILTAVGAISLLYSVGNADLPSTLMGNAVVTRKD